MDLYLHSPRIFSRLGEGKLQLYCLEAQSSYIISRDGGEVFTVVAMVCGGEWKYSATIS